MGEVIGYLGPNGSNCMLAVEQLCASAGKVPYKSFSLIMDALKKGEIDGGVFAIENTLNGGVTQNIDLIQATSGIIAVKECFVKIDHRLVTLNGADVTKIKRIYSHAQALGQCSKYIQAHFPDAELKETASTSGCLKMLKTPFDAGIVGSQCKQDGFTLSDECIADEKTNYTQFLLFKRGDSSLCKSSNKIYFSVTCRHEPGALVKILKIISDYNLNMTRIGSRPIKERVGEYRFFIEMEADYALANVKKALDDIQAAANSLRILGCY